MRRVGGGTGKASGSATNARGRAKAGMDNYSSPQNLGENIHVKILTISVFMLHGHFLQKMG